ncbi:serine/threonine-protein kinase MARK1-like isoform X1 [Bombina bombina]|uniref:serine/threonine-protein kinase MARK1-like isoform X1 n=1 Tax=Bombina bombina TaxID=8345 RepID=UPI00235B0F52|nr:serine/threonine-protein kinase MARK1-like isoform X1 [Bombina bombina]
MGPSSLQQLPLEVTILKMLDHPNIAKLYEVIDTEDILYLCMEYLSGGDLFHYLKDHGRIDEERARVWFRQIVSAVLHCHQKGIAHLDLNTMNILINEDGNIKVADFGVSTIFSSETKNHFGLQIDIQGLGRILYDLIGFSKSPYGAAQVAMRKIGINAFCDFVPDYITTDCENLLRKMLMPDPCKYESLEQLIMSDPWICYVEPGSSTEGPEITDDLSLAPNNEPKYSRKRTRPVSSVCGELQDDTNWSSESPPAKRLESSDDQSDNDIFIIAQSSGSPFIEEHQDPSKPSPSDAKRSCITSEGQPIPSGNNGKRSKWQSFWNRLRNLFSMASNVPYVGELHFAVTSDWTYRV